MFPHLFFGNLVGIALRSAARDVSLTQNAISDFSDLPTISDELFLMFAAALLRAGPRKRPERWKRCSQA